MPIQLDIEGLANLAEIFGAVTVVGGVGFALIQLRELRRQRRDTVTTEMMRFFQEPSFAHALRLVRELPDGVSARDLRARGTEYEEAAIMVAITFETMGLLVYQRTASYSIARELTGGIAVVMCRKLSGWMRDVRVEQSQPSWAEWFQWLAQQFESSESRTPRVPAYERDSGWRPRD